MTIKIRTATIDDAGAIAAIYAPYVASSAVSFEDVPPPPHEIARRMNDTIDHFPWIVAESGGVIMGYAYANRFRDRNAYRFACETSIYVAGDLHGQGIGHSLYRVLLDTLTEQGFTQAVAWIAMPSQSSVELHESIGFKRTGFLGSIGFKHGEWRDIAIWQKTLIPVNGPPEEPQTFKDTGIVTLEEKA
jgi:phosphinothricin acetyltransferase